MVAMPFGLGKLFRSRRSPPKTDRRARLGIRGSLFLAFTVIAATSIVIAGGASYLLRSLDDITIDLCKRDIPRMASSQQLSTLAEKPRLARAGADAGEDRRGARRAAEAAEGHAGRGDDQDQAARRAGARTRRSCRGLEENIKNLDAMINSLNSAAREQLDTVADPRKAVRGDARGARDGDRRRSTPRSPDARIDMNAALGEPMPAPPRRCRR